ncbi:MAG TPA: hypothetical protein VNR65_06170 [Geobacterales bacterium]|nr:hypothetical protein [Geobacterales bacterium]
MTVPCQNSASGLPSLFSRPRCQLLGLPLRKVVVAVTAVVAVAAVAVTVVVVTVVVDTAVVMVAGILAAALTVVVATWEGDRRTPVRLGDRIPAATT